MFLEPSSQYRNTLEHQGTVPAMLRPYLINGSTVRYIVAAGLKVLSQQVAHPEFDLFVHHIYCKQDVEFFGKTKDRKWLWVMQHEGIVRVSLFPGEMLDINAGEHFFTRSKAGKEIRFTVSPSSAVIIIISLKKPGEIAARQYFPEIWRQIQEKGHPRVYSSGYTDHYYREALVNMCDHNSLQLAFLSVHWRLLLLLLNQQLLDVAGFTDIPATKGRKLLHSKQILDQYPAESWTIRELSKITGWNTHDLKIFFKQAFSITPTQYLRKVRLEYAMLLLGSTRQTVVQISRQCGFKRAHHFIRVFKQYYGKTPGQWRQK